MIRADFSLPKNGLKGLPENRSKVGQTTSYRNSCVLDLFLILFGSSQNLSVGFGTLCLDLGGEPQYVATAEKHKAIDYSCYYLYVGCLALAVIMGLLWDTLKGEICTPDFAVKFTREVNSQCSSEGSSTGKATSRHGKRLLDGTVTLC